MGWGLLGGWGWSSGRMRGDVGGRKLGLGMIRRGRSAGGRGHFGEVQLGDCIFYLEPRDPLTCSLIYDTQTQTPISTLNPHTLSGKPRRLTAVLSPNTHQPPTNPATNESNPFSPPAIPFPTPTPSPPAPGLNRRCKTNNPL